MRIKLTLLSQNYIIYFGCSLGRTPIHLGVGHLRGICVLTRALKEDRNFSDGSHIMPVIFQLKHLINDIALVQFHHVSEVQAGSDYSNDNDRKASDIK